MFNPVFAQLPNLDPEELNYLQSVTTGWDQEKVQQFVVMYASRRKDPQIILICCLLGFFGIAGVHRFLVDQVGMGIVYLLTAGLCGIGTIVDLINYRSLATEYNTRQAYQVAAMLTGAQPVVINQ